MPVVVFALTSLSKFGALMQVNPAVFVADGSFVSGLSPGAHHTGVNMVALMSASSTLSIGTEESDRRMFPRKQVTARVEGRRLDHTIDARQNPQLSLSLRDVS